MDLNTVTYKIFYLLTENENLRDDDDLLLVEVYKKINPFVESYGFSYVIKNRKKMGLPSFESIRRTRQKIQALNPELKGSERIERERKIKQNEFLNYARE